MSCIKTTTKSVLKYPLKDSFLFYFLDRKHAHNSEKGMSVSVPPHMCTYIYDWFLKVLPSNLVDNALARPKILQLYVVKFSRINSFVYKFP